jgi:AbrB family looped-hinge helix DNA binding protein
MHTILKGKAYGAVTVGERGQLVIPAELRKALKIKAGEQLMVFAMLDKKIISLISAGDFSDFVERASRMISRLEKEVQVK